MKKQLRFAVLAADVAIFTIHNGKLWVRLIAVHRSPYFIHATGLPGGLIDPAETAEDACRRLIHAKAGIAANKPYIEQLYTFSGIHRDPRGRVVAVAYLALIAWEKLSAIEQKNSEHAFWINAATLPRLAYDHADIIAMALERIKSRVATTTIISKLIPREFTLTELEHAYELIIGTDLDKRNFRKKLNKLKILTETNHKRSGGKFRPAQLYRFKSDTIDTIGVL